MSSMQQLYQAHESVEKGINLGQAVIFTGNNTYVVLSTALATSPWSAGFFFAAGRTTKSLWGYCQSP
jgi:hypothetical protein